MTPEGKLATYLRGRETRDARRVAMLYAREISNAIRTGDPILPFGDGDLYDQITIPERYWRGINEVRAFGMIVDHIRKVGRMAGRLLRSCLGSIPRRVGENKCGPTHTQSRTKL